MKRIALLSIAILVVVASSGCLNQAMDAGNDVVKGVDDFISTDHSVTIPSLKNNTEDLIEGVKNITLGDE